MPPPAQNHRVEMVKRVVLKVGERWSAEGGDDHRGRVRVRDHECGVGGAEPVDRVREPPGVHR